MATALGFSLRTVFFFAGLILVDGAITWTTPAAGDASKNDINEGTIGAVYTFAATATAAITFSLDSQVPADMFLFNTGSGVLTVNSVAGKELDFETNPSLVIKVKAVEAAATPVTSTGTLTINLVNVNEAPAPTCTMNKKTVVDGTVANTVVATLLFTDPDAGDTVVHSFMSGNGLSHFAISGTTGAISVASGVTLSAANQYTLIVKGVDNDATPLTGTATLEVCVGTCNGAVVFFYTSLLTLLCGLLANFL